MPDGDLSADRTIQLFVSFHVFLIALYSMLTLIVFGIDSNILIVILRPGDISIVILTPDDISIVLIIYHVMNTGTLTRVRLEPY